MTFTPEQTKALSDPLHLQNVKSRSQAGRNLSYIEAWWAISEANRIFGFDGWARETVDLIPLSEARMVGDKYRVAYRAKVRITVFAGNGDFGDTGLVREGCGFGSGIDKDADQAHESALKEAESDAMKRALMTFGNPFGLALYDKTQVNVTTARPAPQVQGVVTGRQLLDRQTARDVGDSIERVLNEDLAPTGRKTSAQAKRDGDDAKIKADIGKCDRDGLRDWHENFDSYTAHVPVSWLDSIRDMLELRLEELNAPAEVAEADEGLNEAFRNSVGPASPAPMAGRNAHNQAAA